VQSASPPAPDVPQMLAQALERHRAGDLDGAGALYDRVLAIDPDNFDALHLKGVLLRRRGDAAAAVASIQKAIAATPARAGDAQLNLANALLDAGRAREAIAHYDNALAAAPGDAATWIRRGDAFQLCEDNGAAVESYRRAAALGANDAPLWHNLALALRKLHRADEALEAAERALVLRPNYAEARLLAGNALATLGRHAQAGAHFQAALALKPDDAELHAGLAHALHMQGEHAKARHHYDRAIALRPASTETYFNRAVLSLETLDMAAAQADFEAAIAVQPDHEMAHRALSAVLLATGAFERGWHEYEWRWHGTLTGERKRSFDVPRWSGNFDIKGKRVLLHAEQGFGDTIQFARYVPQVAAMGAHVVLEVQPALKPLFAGMAGVAELTGWLDPVPPVDCHCPVMSLPHAFGTKLETVPAPRAYLQAEPALVAHWRSRLGDGPGLRVGFACSGSTTHKNDGNRSIPIDRFMAIDGGQRGNGQNRFFCLQKDFRAADRVWLAAHPEIAVFDTQLRHFADTAALIEALDLVICVDTSIAHLAGALGKPIWVVIPYNADWRWLQHRQDSPWYPSMRLFRQPTFGDWQTPLDEVAAALRQFKTP
jgi:tetratricopeptide (TPR) repeat protein